MNNITNTSGQRLKRGVFFAFEGIDGAGKTTQAFLLKDYLTALGFPVIYVKEPTEGRWGRKIRLIALNGRDQVTREEELDYFIRDRQEDVDQNIAPALSVGEIVIADRYFYSTLAYQSVLGLDIEDIRKRNNDFPVPDLVFLIDISPRLSQVRITRNRGEEANRGYEQIDFLRQVKAVFDSLPDGNIVRIKGDREKNSVAREIQNMARTIIDGLIIPGDPEARS